MHSFEDQIKRMWNLIKLRIRALRNGYLLEAMDLSYILLEIELRILLSSKDSPERLSTREIVGLDYLSTLADTAKERVY